jgi:hypothetical protein
VELYLHSPNTASWRGASLKHRDKGYGKQSYCEHAGVGTHHHTFAKFVLFFGYRILGIHISVLIVTLYKTMKHK